MALERLRSVKIGEKLNQNMKLGKSIKITYASRQNTGTPGSVLGWFWPGAILAPKKNQEKGFPQEWSGAERVLK